MGVVTVVSGTNRKGSMTFHVSKLICDLLTEKGVEVKLLDLQNLPPDFLFTALYGNKNNAFEKILAEDIYSSSKFVLVSPEYNGGFSGILKGFMDGWNPKKLSGQKVALVGVASGRSGNLRGLDYLTNVCHYLKLPVFYEKIPVSRVSELGTEADGIHDEATKRVLSLMLDGFVKF